MDDQTPAVSFDPRSANILVTGGAGFIGSNFINTFMPGNPGCRVINLDILTQPRFVMKQTAELCAQGI